MATDRTMPILVVDDYRTMLRIIRKTLAQLGFLNVDGASDAAEALGKLRAREYKLIISDWDMEPNGCDLLGQVRAEAARKGTPLLVVAADALSAGAASAAQAAGASGCVVKPIDAADLKSKIDDLCGA